MGADTPLTTLTLAEMSRRTSAKWRVYPDDVLPLWVAEMDVPLAPPVAAALAEAVALGDTGYAAGTGYAEALAAFAAARWNWTDLSVGRTTAVPDVMNGIATLLHLVSEPGDVVVLCVPAYPPFFAYVGYAGRRIVEVPLRDDGRLDLDALDEAFGRARAMCANPVFLLCNPHNPTGVVHTRGELEAVAALAGRHGVRVIADEIHAPVVFPEAPFTPYLSVDGSETGFSVMSASKGWNLAGIKAAVVVAGPAAAADLARIPMQISHGASHFGVIAHTAAFRDGGDWLDLLLADLVASRARLADLLGEHLPGVGYRQPEGTYLAWLDCRGLGIPASAGTPGAFFGDRAKVALSPGESFGVGGAGHVRLNFATSPLILTEAVARMGEALRSV